MIFRETRDTTGVLIVQCIPRNMVFRILMEFMNQFEPFPTRVELEFREY